MKKISNGIVISDDIKRILDGVNAFNYNYNVEVEDNVIDNMRGDFRKNISRIFDGNVSIISEDEMLEVNNLIGGEYPHRNFG